MWARKCTELGNYGCQTVMKMDRWQKRRTEGLFAWWGAGGKKDNKAADTIVRRTKTATKTTNSKSNGDDDNDNNNNKQNQPCFKFQIDPNARCLHFDNNKVLQYNNRPPCYLMPKTKVSSKTTPSTRAAFSCSVCFLDIMFSSESILAPIGTSTKLSRDKASAVTPAYILLQGRHVLWYFSFKRGILFRRRQRVVYFSVLLQLGAR